MKKLAVLLTIVTTFFCASAFSDAFNQGDSFSNKDGAGFSIDDVDKNGDFKGKESPGARPITGNIDGDNITFTRPKPYGKKTWTGFYHDGTVTLFSVYVPDDADDTTDVITGVEKYKRDPRPPTKPKRVSP